MIYREFIEAAEKGMRERLGPDAMVTRDRVRKNNAVCLDALFVREAGETISPVLYLQDFYRRYQKGQEFEQVLEEMVQCYRRGKSASEIDVSFFQDPARVKKRIFPRLVNWEKNREILSRIPHRRFHDLAIVYYCVLEKSRFGDASILIREEHRDMWNMKEQELYAAGRENLYRSLPWIFVSMEEMLVSLLSEKEIGLPGGGDLFGEKLPGGGDGYTFRSAAGVLAEQRADPVPMYILTNRPKSFGAIWMTEESALSAVGDRLGEDFYVLPSSVHECIILPRSATKESHHLRRMVADINCSQVAPEEVLSDSIYLYGRGGEGLIVLDGPAGCA